MVHTHAQTITFPQNPFSAPLKLLWGYIVVVGAIMVGFVGFKKKDKILSFCAKNQSFDQKLHKNSTKKTILGRCSVSFVHDWVRKHTFLRFWAENGVCKLLKRRQDNKGGRHLAPLAILCGAGLAIFGLIAMFLCFLVADCLARHLL